MKKIDKYSIFIVMMAFLIIAACSSSKNEKSITGSPLNGSYQPDTVVYSLNMLSNILFAYVGEGSGLENTAKVTIQKILNDTATQSLIGEWSIAWGPAVFTKDIGNCGDSCVADNLLVLFQKGSNNTSNAPEFVLATSGTNSVSDFGWFTEDFTFDEMVLWPVASGNSPSIDTTLIADKSQVQSDECVSMGTAKGLYALLSTSSNGTVIADGLKEVMKEAKKGSELRVVGHSLGGTLSPVLALILKEHQAYWDPTGIVSTISTAPTAGASPGNKVFRDLFFNTIGVENFYGKMNDMDLVPHGYESDLLNKVPALYSQYQKIDTPCIIQNLINCVQAGIDNSFGSNVYASLYTYYDPITQDSLSKDTLVHFSKPFVEQINGETATLIWSACGACVDGGCDIASYFKGVTPELGRLILHLLEDYPKTKDALNCSGNKCDQIIPTYRYVAEVGYQHVEAYYIEYDIQKFIDLVNCQKSWYGPGEKGCKEDKGMKNADFMKYITVLNSLESFISKLDCN